MCKTGRNGYCWLGLLLLLSLPAWSQDVPLAQAEINRSLSLLTALEQNWQQRGTLSVEREKNLNEIQLSLQAREAFLNEREQRLNETETSLQKREQTQKEIENSLLKVQQSFEILEKDSKKLKQRFKFQGFLLRGSLIGLAGLGSFELGRVLLK